MKLMVDTTEPDISMTATANGKKIQVAWEIVEDNLDTSSLRLEYQTDLTSSGSWTPIPLKASQKGTVEFPPPDRELMLRMQVKDRAGNVGEKELFIVDGRLVFQVHRGSILDAKDNGEDSSPKQMEEKGDPTGKKDGADSSKEMHRQLVDLLIQKYQQACREGQVNRAKKLAHEALEFDPTCFSKDR